MENFPVGSGAILAQKKKVQPQDAIKKHLTKWREREK